MQGSDGTKLASMYVGKATRLAVYRNVGDEDGGKQEVETLYP